MVVNVDLADLHADLADHADQAMDQTVALLAALHVDHAAQLQVAHLAAQLAVRPIAHHDAASKTDSTQIKMLQVLRGNPQT